MADISKITLPDNSSYDIKDATARSKLNVLTNNMATCATGRATAAKVATLANFSLNVGATIAVKFTDTAGTANPTSGNLTLNVNNTGAKTMGFCSNGSKAALSYTRAAYFYNNSTHVFTYDGTYWLCMDWNANTDTKVTSAANHYTPAKSTTKSASGGTLTDITDSTSGTQVVTGVEMDAKGHVTGVTSVALKSTDTNTWRGIQNNLTSTATDQSLSANQGKVLKEMIDGKAASSHTHTKSQITDFPSSLPANGGNADTVDNKHASNFLQNIASWSSGAIKDLVSACTTSGYVLISSDVTGMPINSNHWFGEIHCSSVHKMIRVTRFGENDDTYVMKYNNGLQSWSTWRSANSSYSNMTGATSSAAGKAGLVPAPAAGANTKFLRGDGTWQTVSSSSSSNADTVDGYHIATGSTSTPSGGDGTIYFQYTS